MAKTKFLSKVLAVLMALSMLCSTGVFADYGNGTANDAEIITVTSMTLNGKEGLNAATEVAKAVNVDVADGIQIAFSGTVKDAVSGVVTYVIADTTVLNQEPLDVSKLEASTIAIGTLDVGANGAFATDTPITVAAGAAGFNPSTTYEFRYAYSTTADAADIANTWVYQRYIQTAGSKLVSATVTTAKSRYDIDALPMLDAAEVAFENEEYVIEVPRGTNTASFTVANANGAASEAVEVTMDAPSKAVKATIGDAEYDITVKFDDEYPSLYAFNYGQNFGSANRITVQYGDLNTDATLKFTAKATNVTSDMPLSGVAFANGAVKPIVDKHLVVIGTPAANAGTGHNATASFGWLSKTTNNGTTFKLSAPATVYAKSVAFGNVAWPTIEALDWEVVGTFDGYNLYAKHFDAGATVQIPTQPITQAELDAKNATLNNGTMYAFITEENKALNSGTTGAVGDVILWNHTDGTITSSAPFASGNYAGRSSFYTRATDTAFYAEFDRPPAPGLASAEVTSTLNHQYSFLGNTSTKATRNTDGGTETVTLDTDAEEYVVKVPYGTGIATATFTDGTGTESETVTATFQTETLNSSKRLTKTIVNTDSVTEEVTINGHTYNVTFKWDDTYPYIYKYDDTNYQYQGRNIVSRADGTNRLWSSYTVGNETLSNNGGATYTPAGNGTLVAGANAAVTNIVIDGEAIPNNEYLTVIAPSYSDSFVRGYQKDATSVFHKIARTYKENWTSFVASAAGTVYVPITHANVEDENFVWAEGQAFGWTKVENATFNGATSHVYKKSFNKGETVKIPTQQVQQAEIDYVNAKLQAAYPANNGAYQFKYVLDTTAGVAYLNYANDGLAYDDAGKDWTQIAKNLSPQTTVCGDLKVSGEYMRGQAATGVGTFGTKAFFVAVVFDQPLALGEVTYAVNGGEAEEINFAGDTTANIELPYDTTTVSIEATKAGTGTVTVSPETLDFTSTKTATATVTLQAPGGEPVVYTINFTKSDPKISWESALALGGTPATVDADAANAYNGKLFGGGIYKVAAQSGSINLIAEEVDLEVAYGTEAVVLNDEVKINLLDNNGTGTDTITINGTEYTVNVSWKAFDAAEMSEDAPLLYDLQYHVSGKTAFSTSVTNSKGVTSYFYNVMPTRLTLTEATDLVEGTGDVIDTKGTDDTADDVVAGTEDIKLVAGNWFTFDSHSVGNMQSFNNGGDLNRLHLTGKSFEGMVETGDIAGKYALDGATMLVAHYKDEVADGVERYSFKSAVDGYVIVGSPVANAALTAEDGWKHLVGAEVVTSNQTTAGGSVNLSVTDKTQTSNTTTTVGEVKVPTYQVAYLSTAFDNIYIKKVSVGDEVVVKESSVQGEIPPLVIVATEDMIQERVLKLNSLSYTTALAVTDPEGSKGANARKSKTTLHAGGLYQPTLVGTATAVEVAKDATTIDVTVPYGSEIVNLAGADSNGEKVTFDAINLINNNGAATVKKTVGEIEYTINVKWADYVAANDAAGNHVYDIKYRVKDLANKTYYNIVPAKLVLETTRPARGTKDIYTDETLTTKKQDAGKWVELGALNGTGSNLMVHNNGAAIARGRLVVDAFDNWIKNGLVTVSGFPAVPNAEDVDTDAELDAIAHAAMNGATVLVTHYQDRATVGAAAGVNADMGARMSFKVAQDSIVYVTGKNYNPGAGWTKYDAGQLNFLNCNARGTYYMEADEEGADPIKVSAVTSFAADYCGDDVYYRYAKKDDLVTLATETSNDTEFTPAVIVRPIDLSNVEAPALATLTYSLDGGEGIDALPIEAGVEKTFDDIPWGTKKVSVNATISGVGSVNVSSAVDLTTAEGHADTVTVEVVAIDGTVVAEYTLKFAWTEAPELKALTYSTGTTTYMVETVANKAIDLETQSIPVPWGTAKASVTYELDGFNAVTKTVTLTDGTGSITIAPFYDDEYVITFNWEAAPKYYVYDYNPIGTKAGTSAWAERTFVVLNGANNAPLWGTKGYKAAGSYFMFADDKAFSERAPEGLITRENSVIVVDSETTNGSQAHMMDDFRNLWYSYPALDQAAGTDAYRTFKLSESGYVYAVSSSADNNWAEMEALASAGWEEAPFTYLLDGMQRKVYQKWYDKDALVAIPGQAVTASEIDAENATLSQGMSYVPMSEDILTKVKEAAQANFDNLTTDVVRYPDTSRGYVLYDADRANTPYEKEVTAKATYHWFYGYRTLMDTYDKKDRVQLIYYIRNIPSVSFVLFDDAVDAKFKAPQYTGAKTVKTGEAIDLMANPIYYGEKGEVTFKIVSGGEYAEIIKTENGYQLKTVEKLTKPAVTVRIAAVQNGVESEPVDIAVAELSLNEYGYLTVKAPEGNGSGTIVHNDGTEEGKPLSDNLTLEKTFFDAGATVTLSAAAGPGAVFKHWKRLVNGKWSVYNSNPTITVEIPNEMTLQAVFSKADAKTVTFKGYQNTIIKSVTVDTDTEAIEVPNPDTIAGYEVFGYEFKYFTCAAFGEEKFGSEEGMTSVIQALMVDQDLEFVAHYEPKATMKYNLTVVGGTVNGVEGVTTATLPYDTKVTVVAEPVNTENNKIFQYWTDEAGQILSYNTSYSFYMMAFDRTVIAVYDDKAAEAAPPVITMTVTKLEDAADGPIYALFAERRVPEGYTVIENGLVYGAKDYRGFKDATGETADPSDDLTLDTRVGKATSKYQNRNGQFTARIQMTDTREGKGTQWYARTYLTFKDNVSGEIFTYYSTPATLIHDYNATSEEEVPEDPEDPAESETPAE